MSTPYWPQFGRWRQEAIAPIISAAQTRATKIKAGEIFRLFAILGPEIILADRDIRPSKQCND